MAGTIRWKIAQKLELWWWKRYLKDRQPEVYLEQKKAYWTKVLTTLNWQPQPGDQVLEVGCGPAGIFMLLHEQQRFTALDPLLDQYRENLAIFSPEKYPAVHFVTGPVEIQELPGPYAVIYCFNAINHVADWDKSMDQLTSWAATGTQLLLSSDVHRYGWLCRIFRLLPGDALHPQQHQPKAYRRALQQRGWSIVQEKVLKRGAIFNYVVWVAERED